MRIYFIPVMIFKQKLRSNWYKKAEPLPAPLRYAAFTLIELSIVLVIIGLIVGGVLVGRDMYEIAQARALMQQMQDIQVAVNTFRLKYSCLPGDCATAVQLGLGRDGNGDKLIGGRYGQSTTSWPICLRGGTPNGCMADRAALGSIWGMTRSYGEHQQFWAHLSAAELIDADIDSLTPVNGGVDAIIDTVYPKDALGKHYLTAAHWNSKLHIRTGLQTVTSSFGETRFSSNGTVSAAQMKYISDKLGGTIYVGYTDSLPTAISNNEKVVPLSSNANNINIQYYYYHTPESVGGAPACVVSVGGSGYIYNIEGNGRCDFLWELDF